MSTHLAKQYYLAHNVHLDQLISKLINCFCIGSVHCVVLNFFHEKNKKKKDKIGNWKWQTETEGKKLNWHNCEADAVAAEKTLSKKSIVSRGHSHGSLLKNYRVVIRRLREYLTQNIENVDPTQINLLNSIELWHDLCTQIWYFNVRKFNGKMESRSTLNKEEEMKK